MAAVWPEAGVVHRVEHRRCTGLRPSRTSGSALPDDHAHRVVDVAALHLLLDVDRFDAVGLGLVSAWGQGVCHLFLVRG